MTIRPKTLSAIAAQADTLENFGGLLGDWLHEVREFTTRKEAIAAIEEEPEWLAPRYLWGAIADAWLAAYAETLAIRAGKSPPAWAFGEGRVAREPWFASPATSLRARVFTLRDTPGPFKRRNIYTPSVELRFFLRAGRPRRTVEEKRAVNRERQRLFQARRREELIRLREQAAAAATISLPPAGG